MATDEEFNCDDEDEQTSIDVDVNGGSEGGNMPTNDEGCGCEQGDGKATIVENSWWGM